MTLNRLKTVSGLGAGTVPLFNSPASEDGVLGDGVE